MNTGIYFRQVYTNFCSFINLSFKTPLKLILLFTIGWAVLILFIFQILAIVLIHGFQVPTYIVEQTTKSKHHFLVTCLLLLSAWLPLFFKYAILPLLFFVLEIFTFFYNVFAFVVTAGKNRWIDLPKVLSTPPEAYGENKQDCGVREVDA